MTRLPLAGLLSAPPQPPQPTPMAPRKPEDPHPVQPDKQVAAIRF